MKISHESPICMLDESRSYNDYDYALVHLFETHPEYLNFFKESLESGRTVYLDNSIFELGEAFDVEKFIHYIKELSKHDRYGTLYYVIPDVLRDSVATVDSLKKFKELHNTGKSIGVVQASNFAEFVSVLRIMKQNVDIVAIPFNLPFYREDSNGYLTMEEEFSLGRVKIMHRLKDMGELEGAQIHLLGCFTPKEYRSYNDIPEIISADTSHPVVHGIKGISYESEGLSKKHNTKLFELIDYQKDSNYNIILENISKFKEIIRG